MATQVILPALGMAQETGIIVQWLKSEGEEVAKGEPLAEIETDKATVEIEAPASGVLANVAGAVGVAIPVGLVIKAQAGKLRPQDIEGGTFTISNLGMYNVDAFNAIINQPQAAILAVGRIAERVVPVNGQPAVQPMMVLTLSCDHRAVDGARGARFLDTVATLIEEPLGLLDGIG